MKGHQETAVPGPPASPRVAVITLGCPKNEVDSEVLQGLIRRAGLSVTTDPEEASHVFINTCAFIQPALQESLEEIRYWLQRRQQGQVAFVGVTGCLVERFRHALPAEVLQADAVLGIDEIPRVLEALRGPGFRMSRKTRPRFLLDHRMPRFLPRPLPYRYVKVADGCNHTCSFCTIPAIRGRQRSRPVPDLLEEIQHLLAAGTREIILVAQDLGDYGRDLEPRTSLPQLLEALAGLPAPFWLRLLYLHPVHVNPALIQAMKDHPKLAPYVEMPIQHASAEILRAMQRAGGARAVRRAVDLFRTHLPNWYLRTEVIVGFPGETDEHFTELLTFLEVAAFERIGVFPFWPEPGTPAARREPRVPAEVLEDRLSVIQAVAQQLVHRAQERLVGQRIPVLLEAGMDGVAVGRTPYDAPEVDLQVRVPGADPTSPGPHTLRIQQVLESLDLQGRPIEEEEQAHGHL